MNSKYTTYTSIFFVGVMVGFFIEDEKFGDPMPWQVLLFVTPIAFIFILAFMGLAIVLYSKRVSKYFYYIALLSTVIGVGFGVSMVFQALYLGQLSATNFFSLAIAIGYILGFPFVQKVAKRRYGTAF